MLWLMPKVVAITLFPFGIYVRDFGIKTYHEQIHWVQQKEMLCLFFYLWYLIEWFIKLFKYKNKAYYAISFEREAYDNESNLNYLKTRKSFAWLNKVFNI